MKSSTILLLIVAIVIIVAAAFYFKMKGEAAANVPSQVADDPSGCANQQLVKDGIISLVDCRTQYDTNLKNQAAAAANEEAKKAAEKQKKLKIFIAGATGGVSNLGDLLKIKLF